VESEHIALLGKCLVSNEEKSYNITRYLADYVLIWTTRFAGHMGDDIAKMPHMANIAGSVYNDVPRQGYYIDEKKGPSSLMKKSLLYQLTFYGMGQHVNYAKDVKKPVHFEDVFISKNKMVRIWKVINPEPRRPFDGKYPPEIELGQFKE